MTTEAAWQPQSIPGGGRDSRFERRRSAMESLWGEAWQLADAGDRDGALDLFLEANDDGMGFPTEDSRRCALTGDVALGYARVPFTDWNADVAISHGRDEQRPTALDRWVGWTDQAGREHAPTRPSVRLLLQRDRLVLPVARTEGGAPFGAEGPFRRLSADAQGARVEFDYARDGSVVVRSAPDGGPRPVED